MNIHPPNPEDNRSPFPPIDDDYRRNPVEREYEEGYSVDPRLPSKPARKSETIVGSLIVIAVAVLGLLGSYYEDEKVSGAEVSAAIAVVLPSANNIKERFKNQRSPIGSLW